MNEVRERSRLTICIDRPTKESFTKLCNELGLPVSSCIVAMMRQAVREHGINLSLLDENGFTPEEAKELKRRADDLEKD